MRKKNRILRKLGVTASMAAVFGLVSSGVFVTTTNMARNDEPIPPAIESMAVSSTAESPIIATAAAGGTGGILATDVPVTTEDVSTGSLTIPEVTALTMPAMVAITNTTVQEIEDFFGGYGFGGFGGFGDFGFDDGFGDGNGGTTESVSMGSGIIIKETDDQLLIATNAHVVEDATTLSVAFVDDTAVSAEILGADSGTDLAVIAVNKSDLTEDTLKTIRVISIGSSDDLVVGESVVAIGNALGYGQSVSAGIVSALHRQLFSSDGTTEGTEGGLIQTDAAINPGNSGGALLNMKGELIGINSAKYASTEVEGMGYAIPITQAMEILDLLSEGKTPAKEGAVNLGSSAYLGISCTSITSDYADYYGLPEGVYVKSVESGSAAENAGILEGDIITDIGGTSVGTVTDLTNALSAYQPGDSTEITVMRESADASAGRMGPSASGYEAVTLKVTFDSRNDLQQTSTAGIIQ